MIKITLGGPQATVELKARKALDGSLLIMDHKKIDIAVAIAHHGIAGADLRDDAGVRADGNLIAQLE